MSDKTTIAEMRTYIDSEGRRVVEFIEVYGKDKGKSSFKGQGMIMARSPDPRIPPQQLPFDFSFPEGTTLKKAFEIFDVEAQKKVDAIQKQRQDQARIIGARTMPAIMGPNGKPMQPKAGG